MIPPQWWAEKNQQPGRYITPENTPRHTWGMRTLHMNGDRPFMNRKLFAVLYLLPALAVTGLLVALLIIRAGAAL